MTAAHPLVLQANTFAGVAQLVEHELPKLEVAGSNPVARSTSVAPTHHFTGPLASAAGPVLFALSVLVGGVSGATPGGRDC